MRKEKRIGRILAGVCATALFVGNVNMANPVQVQAATPKVKVDSVDLSYNTYLLKRNQSVKLKATCLPQTAKNKKVKWSTSNPSIASVSASGKVTARREGTAKITAVSRDGSKKKAVCTIKVVKQITKIKNLKLASSVTTIAPGATLAVKSVIKPAKVTLKSLKWESSDTSVATVNKKGVVKAISTGTVKITAKAQDGSKKKASITIKVGRAPITQITLKETDITMRAGKTRQIEAEVAPADASKEDIIWASTNEAVVKVDTNGLLTAVAEGTATITATGGAGVTTSCSITVLPAETLANNHVVAQNRVTSYVYDLDRNAEQYKKVSREPGKESVSYMKRTDISNGLWKLALAVRNGIKTPQEFYTMFNTACEQNALVVFGIDNLKVKSHSEDYTSMTLQTAAMTEVYLTDIKVTEPAKAVTDPNGIATKASRVSFKIGGQELILEITYNASRIAIYRPNYSQAHFEFIQDNKNMKYTMRMTTFFNGVLIDEINSFPDFKYLDMYNVY